MIFKDIPDFFNSFQKAFLRKYHKEIFDNRIISYIERPDNIDFGYKRMIGIKRLSKNYLLMEKKQITEKMKDIKKLEKKEHKDNINNIMPLSEEKYENDYEKKSHEENLDQRFIRSLFSVENDQIYEIKKIDSNFYKDVSQSFYFEKNIVFDPNK